MAAPRVRPTETTAARVAMLTLGVGHRELATRLGVSTETLTNWMAGDFPGNSGFRFEAALGYTAPIWSRARDLKLRQQCAVALGFDPYLVSRPNLKERARALGLTVRRDDSLPQLRSMIMQFLAANPNRLLEPIATP